MTSAVDESTFAKNNILSSLPTILLIADPFLPARTQALQSLNFNVYSVAGFTYPHVLKKELPRQYGQRVADLQIDYLSAHSFNAATDGVGDKPDQILLGIITTVYCGRSVVGQHVTTAQEAQAILQKLSGRRHRVLTTLAIKYGQKKYKRQVETMVEWKRLSASEIDQYMAVNLYQNKVGGYLPAALEIGRFIKSINGMPSNLVGAPLLTLSNMLSGLQ